MLHLHNQQETVKSLQTCNNSLSNYALGWSNLVFLVLRIPPLEAKQGRIFKLTSGGILRNQLAIEEFQQTVGDFSEEEGGVLPLERQPTFHCTTDHD